MPLPPLREVVGGKSSNVPDITSNKSVTSGLPSLRQITGQVPNITSSTSTSNSTPATKTPLKTPNPKDGFRWVIKQLNKPMGVAAEGIETASNVAGSLLLPLSDKFTLGQGLKMAGKEAVQGAKDIYNVAAGNKETSFSGKLEEKRSEFNKLTGAKQTKFDKASDFVTGLGGDIAVDPSWILTPAKVVKYVGEATKLNIPAEKLATAFAKTPLANALKTTFSTTSGNKEFDTIVDTFRNLRKYKESKLMDDAVSLQKDIQKFGKGAEEIITEGLENPKSLEAVTDPEILATVSRLKDTYKSFLKESRSVGLTVGEIADYAPHIRTTESFLNGLKREFTTGAREWGAGKITSERKILKFVSDTGEDVLGDYKKLGLKRLNKNVFIDSLEKAASKKVEKLNIIREKLLSKKINLLTGDLQDIKSLLRKSIVKDSPIKGAIDDIAEPTAEELDNIVKSIVYPKRDELLLQINDLEALVKHSSGKEFLSRPLLLKQTKNQKIKWLSDEIIKTQNDLADNIIKLEKFNFIGDGNKLYRSKTASVKELGEAGIDIFEKNPAIQLAKKGLAYTKAITSKQFANEVSKFASNAPDAVQVTNPLLKGMKFAPDQARVIDNFYKAIKPEELNVILKDFDDIQNLWKAQALISPSYHTRNVIGNFWNNFLAGVNPKSYYDSIRLAYDKSPKALELKELIKKLGVTDEGFYAADISDEIAQRVGKPGWNAINPLSQSNIVFKRNKKIGTILENHARVSHWLSKMEEGLTPVEAARSVKKYLFDYADLTTTEKLVMKRIMPFYTWTRKNLPVQLNALFEQPAKMSIPGKVINQVEKGAPEPDEKYMSKFIGENVPVRIRKNKEGNTEYFLLGNWLPFASAIDLMSQPLESLVSMASPAAKIPYEYFSGKSTTFKNTLGEPQEIKGYGEFMGQMLPNKQIQLLRNIRVLNDFNKLIDKKDPEATKDTKMVKFLNMFFGKTQTYDENKSRVFYNRDTQNKIDQFKQDININFRKGYEEQGKKLIDDLNNFVKERTTGNKVEGTNETLDSIKNFLKGVLTTPEAGASSDIDYTMKKTSKMTPEEFTNWLYMTHLRNKIDWNIKKGYSEAQAKEIANNEFPKNTGSTDPVVEERLVDEGNGPIKKKINVNSLVELLDAYKIRPAKVEEYGGAKKTIGNIDLETKKYATNPEHVKQIKEIYNSEGVVKGKPIKDYTFNEMQKEFARLNSPLQHISGNISKALAKYGITPGEFIAVVRKDSGAGTVGAGAKTKNPGNVGNTDDGSLMKFGTWLEGSIAAIRNLAERKTRGIIK